MRTTIVLDDELEERLTPLAGKKKLSDFINKCLWDYFKRRERTEKLKRLEASYERASKQAHSSKDFEALDVEDWPEW